MPKEKSFSVDKAIEAAIGVFWDKGFDQATIADLIEATGVQRQSLYNAVGDKNQLFVRVLLKYEGDHRKAAFSRLEAMGDPVAALRALFAGAVASCSPENGPLGCLLVNTAIELPLHMPEVQTVVRAAMDDMRAAIQRLIEHGQVRGELPDEIDAKAAAAALQASLVGIRVMARGAADEGVLRSASERALAVVGLVT